MTDTSGMTHRRRASAPAGLAVTVLGTAGGWLILLAVLAVPGAIRAATPAPNISISDGAYAPATLTIAQHDAVFWKNDGSAKHTVTADDGSFDSGPLNPGDAFGNVFDVAGTFAYHDTTSGSRLKGTITVTPVAATSVPTGPTPPAGTLPPNFHTPVPAPTDSSAATPGPTSPPAGVGAGGSANGGAVLGALLVLVVIGAVAVTMFRRRRSG